MRFARLALSKRKNPVQSLAPKPAFVNFNAIHSLRNQQKMAAAAPSHADPAAASAKSTYSTVTEGRFVDLPEKLEFAKMEENTLKFWTEIDAFKTSLKQSEGKPRYSFYDGPPFATGLPHYGHILAGTIKDIVCRYAHQTGHHVERRFGWDCHGLPVEFEIEKKLGVKVIERNFPRYDLYGADEVFLTGTGAEVIAGVKIDGRVIGKGVAGPMTKQLIKHFRDYANSTGTPVYEAVKAK